MAFTKVTNAGIGSTNTVLLHNLNVVGTVTATDGIFSGIGSFGGNVSVGGVLTYEDVTNVDSVGLITARNGITVLGAGVTIAAGGLNVNAGVSTFGGNITVGSGITLSPDGDSYFTGISTLLSLRVGSNAVTANTAGDDVVIEGASDRGLSIISGSSSTGNIYFGDSSDADIGRVMYNHNDNALQIYTNAAASPNVLITSAGLVGIGTITPSVPLHVLSNSTGLRIQRGSESLTVNANYGGANHCALEFTSALSLFPGGSTEKIRILSNGKLLVGATSSRSTAAGDHKIQVESTSTEGISLTRTTADAGGINLSFVKTRNGAVVQSGDDCGAINWFADDGTDTNSYVARLQGAVDGTPGSNDTPGRLVFSTTADGDSTTTERLRITSSGQLLAGTTSARTNFRNGATGNGTTPQYQFETANDDALNDISLTYGRNNAYGAEIIFAKHRAATVGGTTIVQSGDRLGGISFSGSDGTNFQPAAFIEGEVDGTPGTDDMPGRLVFCTTVDGAKVPTERLRISSTGLMTQTGQTRISQSSTHSHGLNAGTGLEIRGDAIGNGVVDVDFFKGLKIALNDATEWGGQAQFSVGRWTDDGNKAKSTLMVSLANNQINSSSDADTNIFMCRSDGYFLVTGDGSWGAGYQTEGVSLRSSGDSTFVRTDSPAVTITRKGNAGKVLDFYSGTTYAGGIHVDGATSTALQQGSDYRLKDNVNTMTDGITKIKQLNPIYFTNKQIGGVLDTTTTQTGFLAHEVQTVIPTLVDGEKDGTIDEKGKGYQTLNYAGFSPTVVAAMKELIAKVETLEAEVAALKSS